MARRQSMSRKACWLPLVAVISGVVGCGGTDVGSRWATNAVVVDGDTEEWSGPELTYMEKLSGAVGAANTDSSLYVMVRFADPVLGRKIAVGGATVWWNRDGKKKKGIGIRFSPLFDTSHLPEQMRGSETARPDGRGAGGGPPDGPGAGPREGRPEGRLHNIVTLVHEGGEMLLLEGEPGPVAAASAFRTGLYCYEVQIPLHSSDAGLWAIESKPGEDVHLCLELGGVNAETEEAGGEGRREGTPGSGGMGPGGMPPGGMSGGRGGPGGMRGLGGMGRGRGPEDMMQETELWCKIHLAEGPHDTSRTR
jgi:hypothetical protein